MGHIGNVVTPKGVQGFKSFITRQLQDSWESWSNPPASKTGNHEEWFNRSNRLLSAILLYCFAD